MYRFILTLSIFCTIAWGSKCQVPEAGVPFDLAKQRQQSISKIKYDLTFTIPAQRADSITAQEILSIDLKNDKEPLVLDFRQDKSRLKSLRVNGKNAVINHQNEHLIIAKKYLVKGFNKIDIDFIAGNESLNRNPDYLYALFVPDRARTVFPCFDQPDLKAIFSLTLKVPAGWSVLANASLKDSIATNVQVTYRFSPSDVLPTYLFSFTAGKFAVADKMNMRFLYRETDTAKIRLSVDAVFQAHSDAIAFLESWTGIAYPFQKIGFVGIPSFQFGGMEHPGEVQYNAPALFLDDGATKDQLIARSSLISHETAHMWFGDLVTMKWFNDVWMKEVFANFMADKVTEKMMGSETFNLKFLLDHTPAAYGVDRTNGANPIRQQLDNLKDAGSLYGNMIYHKAPVMMRQLELLMGEENFRNGVREYLATFKYSNANWDDLIKILSKHTKEELPAWNKVWVNRPGRPVFESVYKDGKLLITQHAESGDDAIWPQRFSILVSSGGKDTVINLNMKDNMVALAFDSKPDAVLFNSDGTGYGLFPAFINEKVYRLQRPIYRASAYINAYENMLANRGITPQQLLAFLQPALQNETSELNLRIVCSYISNVFWNFLTPVDRARYSNSIEETLWSAMTTQQGGNNKKLLFKSYQDLYTSKKAEAKMLEIWNSQKSPDSVKLTEDDYISIATTIAIKTDTVTDILQRQMNRITNADRKSRLQFLMPALSADSATRDKFFAGLSEIPNRRQESWVAAGLSYMNHPLRQKTFVKHLGASLEMLQDVQKYGDVFFPQNWLSSIFNSHQSKEAWTIVQQFLKSHADYNPKLKAKILQSTDNLRRAQSVISQTN